MQASSNMKREPILEGRGCSYGDRKFEVVCRVRPVQEAEPS